MFYKNLHKYYNSIRTLTPIFVIKRVFMRLIKKNIYLYNKSIIRGITNIETYAPLKVGTTSSFMHKKDYTFLKVEGKLIINSNFNIGKGCRIVIGPNAICEFGQGYITANTLFLIHHGLKMGNNVAISWGCEFLDDDLHEINYKGRINKKNNIEIGNNVWIGSGVKILKGVKINDGNIIAAGSVVTKSFLEKNILIAGNPAKPIKQNISWGKIADKSFMKKKI